MKTIGLTGGFGTGKTTVLEMFEELGALTLSSDQIVHEELKNNVRVQKKIASVFGQQFVSGKTVDKHLLAQKVFTNPKDLVELGRLLHPIVKKSICAWLGSIRRSALGRGAVCVVEVPLLFETGFDKIFDVTVVVAAGPGVQRRRMLKEGRFSQEDMELRMRFQMPLEAKIKACDFVIDNNKDKRQTFKQVKKLMGSLRKGGSKWKN